MDLGFALEARFLEANAQGRVSAAECVVSVPRAVDEAVAAAYVSGAQRLPRPGRATRSPVSLDRARLRRFGRVRSLAYRAVGHSTRRGSSVRGSSSLVPERPPLSPRPPALRWRAGADCSVLSFGPTLDGTVSLRSDARRCACRPDHGAGRARRQQPVRAGAIARVGARYAARWYSWVNPPSR